jgi:hypothetical protein
MPEIVQKTIVVTADTKKFEGQIRDLKKTVDSTSINLDVNTKSTQAELKTVTGTVKTLENALNDATRAKSGLERGTSGTGGVSNATRDFSRQAQGLGGLVHIYAAVAANVYATSEAFSALSKAMDVVLMKESMDKFAANTGQNIAAIADSMQKITEGALKLPDAVRLTNLGTSSGLTAKQLELLTIGAKGASAALGRDLSDSMDRVVRGIAKIEPELLDELGVTIRAGQAYKEYAKTLGVAADELTGFQRTQAYANAVSDQLLEKYESIAKEVPVNAFTKLAAAIKTATDSALGFVGKGLTPIIDGMLAVPNAVTLGLIAATAKLTQLALPSILSFKDRALKEAQDLQDEYARIQSSASTAKLQQLIPQIQPKQIELAKQQRLIIDELRDSTEDLSIYSNKLVTISQLDADAKKDIRTQVKALQKDELDLATIVKARTTLEMNALTAKQAAQAKIDAHNAGSLKLSEKQLALYQDQLKASNGVLTQVANINSALDANTVNMTNIAKLEKEIADTKASVSLPVAMQLKQLEAQHAIETAKRKALLIDITSVYGVMSKEAKDYSQQINAANIEYQKQRAEIKTGTASIGAMGTSLAYVTTAATALGVAVGRVASTLSNLAFGLPGLAVGLALAFYEPIGKALGMINKYQDEVDTASEGLKKFAESSEEYFNKVQRKLQDAQVGTENYAKIVQQNTTNIEDLTTAIEKQFDALAKYRKEYENSNWIQKLFMVEPEKLVTKDIAKSLLQTLETAATDNVGATAMTKLMNSIVSKEQLELLITSDEKLKKLEKTLANVATGRYAQRLALEQEIKALKESTAEVEKQLEKNPQLAEQLANLRKTATSFLTSFEKPMEALSTALDKVGMYAPELDANIARLQEPINTLTASMREQLGVISQYQKTGNVSALEAVFKNTQGYIEQTIPKARELIEDLIKGGKFKDGQGEAALAALDANINQLKDILKRSAELDLVLSNARLPDSIREKALKQKADLADQLRDPLAAAGGITTGTIAGASDKANKFNQEKDQYQALLDQARLFLELEKSAADVLKERIDLNAKLGILSEEELFSGYQKAALSEQAAQYELTKLTIAKQAQDATKNGLSYDKSRALALAEQTNQLKVQSIELSTAELKANAALTASRQDLELKRETLRVAKDYAKLAAQFGGMSTAEAASIEIQAEMLEMQSQRNKTQEQLNSLKVNEAKLSFDDFQNAINKQQYLERSLELQDANYQLYLKIAPLQQQANIAQQQYNNYLNAYNSVLGTIYQAEANITLLKEKQNAYIEAQVALINASTNKSPEEKRLETIALISQEYDKLKAKELDFGINISSSDSIVSGMQSAIKSADQLRVIFENQVLAQEELAKRMDATGASEKTRAKELSKLNKQNFRDNLAGYSSLAGAAASLFDRESAQAKALYDLEKMLAIATLAMDAQKLASKLGLIGAEQAHAAAAGTTAVLTQGAGDPYTAWPRIAAMTAVVAGLLAGIGTNLTSSSVTVASGALGGSGAESPVGSTESSKSLSAAETYLTDIEADQYRELRKIFTEMQNLNSNITGFVTALYTSGDIRSIGANPVGVGFKDNPVAESLRNLGDSFNSIPVVGNILSGVGNFIGNAISSVFGGGSSTSVTGSGLFMPNFTLGSGVDLKSYTDYVKKTDGGWFGSSRTDYYSTYADISGQSEAAFQAVFTNLREGILSIGDALNRNIESQVNSFTISIGKIATSGKTGAEIEQALQEAISTQSDKLAYAIFPDLVTKYAKLNEGYFETLIRLVADKAIVESTFGDMGLILSTNADIINISQNLVKFSGSISDFVSNSGDFVSKFYSDEQKLSITTRKVNDLFASLNLTLPTSAQSLVDIVHSLDLTTESGQQAFVSITKASEVLDEYYSSLESASDKLIETADSGLTALQKAIDAEKKLLNDAYNERVDSLNAEKKALTDTKTAADALSKSLKSAYDSIFKSIADPVASYKQAQASLVNLASSGSLPEQEYLNSLLSSATSNTTKYYSTFEDYARDQAVTGKAISDLLGLSDNRLSTAEAQLLATETTLTTLKETLDNDIAALDATIDYYERQLDALKGIDNSVLSVQAAVVNLESYIAAASMSVFGTPILPSFDVGTNYVSQDMVAQIHKGEMIVPAKFNPATSGLQVNQALLEEIKALRQEVSELKAQDRQIGIQLIKANVKTADYIEQWDTTGLKVEVMP